MNPRRCKIDSHPSLLQIIIVDVGKKDSPYNDFVSRLPDNDCRFAGEPAHTQQSSSTMSAQCIVALRTATSRLVTN